MAKSTAPAFVEPDAPAKDKLQRVVQLAEDLVRTNTDIASLERQLEQARAQAYELAHRRIPDAMDEAGTDMVGLPDCGYDVRIRPWYDGSLPKVDPRLPDSGHIRQRAIDWIVENEHGDLIKTTVTILFGRHEHNVAVSVFEAVRQYLAEQGLSNIVALQEDIHHMTYKAFLREQTEAGEVLPLDILNATIGRVAKVEERKNR